MNTDTGIYLNRSSRRIVDRFAQLHGSSTPDLVEYITLLYIHDIHRPTISYKEVHYARRRLAAMAVSFPHLSRRLHSQWGFPVDWDEENRPLPF